MARTDAELLYLSCISIEVCNNCGERRCGDVEFSPEHLRIMVSHGVEAENAFLASVILEVPTTTGTIVCPIQSGSDQASYDEAIEDLRVTLRQLGEELARLELVAKGMA
jgi:hypothetical protein